jgi:hypothetical protein
VQRLVQERKRLRGRRRSSTATTTATTPTGMSTCCPYGYMTLHTMCRCCQHVPQRHQCAAGSCVSATHRTCVCVHLGFVCDVRL